MLPLIPFYGSSDKFIQLKRTAKMLSDKINCPVITLFIRSCSAPDAIFHLNYQQKYYLIILGASSKSLLPNAIHGNIPEVNALKSNTTVIIVRNYL